LDWPDARIEFLCLDRILQSPQQFKGRRVIDVGMQLVF
jgi:hypothetical protein